MLAGFARRSDCGLKGRGRSRALGRSDTACRFVGRWITFRRTEGEPVGQHDGPVRTGAGRLKEIWARSQ